MIGRAFVDSNIWCYVMDGRDLEKQERAATTIRQVGREGGVVSSTQVLSEVYAVVTRKLDIDAPTAKDFIRRITSLSYCVSLQASTVERAIDISVLEGINYWDGLILAAAIQASCDTLITEDMQSGATLQGVRLVNPFLP